MRPPVVSVVISVYNGERYLAQAVESVLSQNFEDFECIVINDGSTDSTASILQEYECMDKRIRVYHQQNLGVPASSERGRRMARGRYVARLDADDLCFPERLKVQVEFLEKNPEIVLLGGAAEMIDPKGIPFRTARLPETDGDIRKALLNENCFVHSTVMFRNSAVDAVGGYRPIFRYALDYDLWLRISERFKVANLSVPLAYYRVHPDQISAKRLKSQIIYALAARLAAQRRRDNSPDPFDSGEEITLDILQRLGVSHELIQEAVVRRFLAAADVLLEAGAEPSAVELWNDALASGGRKYFQKPVLFQLYRRNAKKTYSDGQIPRSLMWLLKACFEELRHITAFARARLRRAKNVFAP